MKSKKIIDYSYFTDIYLLWDCTKDVANKWVRRKFGSGEDFIKDNCAGRFTELKTDSGKVYYLMWIDTKLYEPYWTLSILKHEVDHVVWRILDNAGLDRSWGAEEAHTYFGQYLFSECMKALKVHKHLKRLG